MVLTVFEFFYDPVGTSILWTVSKGDRSCHLAAKLAVIPVLQQGAGWGNACNL